MAEPGWYPDPSGMPGLVRYWDGQTWTQDVSGPTLPANKRGNPTVWIIAGVIVLMVALIVGTLMVRPWVTGTTDPVPGGGPASSGVWTPGAPTASSSGGEGWQGSTAPPLSDPQVSCPEPSTRQLIDGYLTMTRPAGWDDYGTPDWTTCGSSARLYDAEDDWIGTLEVGPLTLGDSSPQAVASSLWTWTAAEYFNPDTDPMPVLSTSAATTVAGKSAWRITGKLTWADDPGGSFDVLIEVFQRPDGYLSAVYADWPSNDKATTAAVEGALATLTAG